MAPVRLCGVSKSFGTQGLGGPKGQQTNVLSEIDLEVADQEFMVLVGPSGCGKSTLLRLIAGLESVSAGEIYLGNQMVNHLPPKERDIAMVFQSYALYPHMTVYDNIAFGLRRQQMQMFGRFAPWQQKHRDSVNRRVQEVATSLQIDHLLNRKPKALSGGQKQRVALGRAIARNPQVFLMDEPLSNLDAQLRSDTRTQIVQLQKRLQVTTIYVTHDQTEAMTMGDRIMVLNRGRIQQVDTPLNLYRHPANRFVAGFLGEPPMNFIPGQIDDQGNVLLLGLTIALTPAQRQVIPAHSAVWVGIRPERLILGINDLQDNSFEAAIELIEMLGSEAIVLLRIGTQTLQAKVTADVALECNLRVGFWVRWILEPEQLYFFARHHIDNSDITDAATDDEVTLYSPYRKL
ncbi:MAG: ABC transporter ATP-binding protein [Pseudanabaenaceae cyanobacterium]|jgi:multiple sugar transport system ATP-binding protein